MDFHAFLALLAAFWPFAVGSPWDLRTLRRFQRNRSNDQCKAHKVRSIAKMGNHGILMLVSQIQVYKPFGNV